MFNVLFFNKVIASREINWQRLTFWIFWSFGCSSARFCWGCSRPDMNNIENLFSIYLWKYPFVSGGSGNKIQIPFTLGQLLAALSAVRGRRVFKIFKNMNIYKLFYKIFGQLLAALSAGRGPRVSEIFAKMLERNWKVVDLCSGQKPGTLRLDQLAFWSCSRLFVKSC